MGIKKCDEHFDLHASQLLSHFLFLSFILFRSINNEYTYIRHSCHKVQHRSNGPGIIWCPHSPPHSRPVRYMWAMASMFCFCIPQFHHSCLRTAKLSMETEFPHLQTFKKHLFSECGGMDNSY